MKKGEETTAQLPIRDLANVDRRQDARGSAETAEDSAEQQERHLKYYFQIRICKMRNIPKENLYPLTREGDATPTQKENRQSHEGRTDPAKRPENYREDYQKEADSEIEDPSNET